ncbi:hypothetical protein M8494_32135 [Serratia ureilytica]
MHTDIGHACVGARRSSAVPCRSR